MRSFKAFLSAAKISQQPRHHANTIASGLVWDITRGEEAIPAAAPVSRLLNSFSGGASGKDEQQADNALVRDKMFQIYLYMPGILGLKGTLRERWYSASPE